MTRRRTATAARLAWACTVALLSLGCDAPKARPPREPGATTLELVIVADLQGVLEPCGCGGRPAGGVDRVVAAVDAWRSPASWPVVLAAGTTFASIGSLRERSTAPEAALWKSDAMVDALRRLRPSALAPSAADLQQAAGPLGRLRAAVKGLVLCGATSGAASALLQAPFPLGLATATWSSDGDGEELPSEVDARTRELAIHVRQLRQRGARVVIAAIHGGADATDDTLLALGADVVVQTGRDTVEASATVLGGRTLRVRPAQRGEALTRIELVMPAHTARGIALSDHPTRVEAYAIGAWVRHHVLDAAAPADPELRAMLRGVFARIDAQHAHEAALDPTPAADRHEPMFVGSETCAACHVEAYYWWRASPHGRALDALLARRRQHDFECVGCHSTGFDPEAPSLRGLGQRAGVGCESCHGPGSAHAENPRPPHRGITRSVAEARCATCHDREHSPAFDYTHHSLALLSPAHGGRRLSPR